MNLLANFAKAVDPAVKVVFNGNFNKPTSVNDKICKVMTAEDYITEIGSNVNVGMARFRAESASVNYEDFLAGDAKNLTQYTYDKGIKISKKLIDWNKRGQIKSLVESAGKALFDRKQFDTTKLLERGFLTTYTHARDGSAKIDLTGGDSLALFTASHSTKRTSTAQSNIIYDGKQTLCRLGDIILQLFETPKIILSV